jgi:hypothetical protein
MKEEKKKPTGRHQKQTENELPHEKRSDSENTHGRDQSGNG